MMALDYGINIVKFFPVYQLGGVEILQQYNNGPFGKVEWVVTGGLGSHNFLPLLAHKNTLAAGGDWMFADNNALVEKNYAQITANTRASIQSVLDLRASLK
jgi:2-dehydro-3-deoxyphosphogluconate aldolase/(4S)-4-hydroxy-2-oxoglutarate aldolase